MDISGVSIPTTPPTVQQTPPQDAQLQNAVRETSQSEASQNNAQADAGSSGRSDADGDRDNSSSVGRNVDVRA